MYHLKNFMEVVVENQINELVKIMNICNCEKCHMDIMAIALNELPPKYVVSEKGELFSKLSELQQQFDVDVQTAIIKAALFVSKNPKHEPINKDL